MADLIAPVNGIDIAYAIEGSGPVVVLIHGLACGRRMWRRQVSALRSSFTVLSYDQRGHGRSSAPIAADAYSPTHLTRDLAALLDHLGVKRCHLVGFSLGGGPALGLAASQPARVASLTLADVGAGAESQTLLASVTRRWIELGWRAGMPILAEEMLRGEFYKHYAESSPRACWHMRALILQTPPHGLLFTLSEVLAKRRSLYRMSGVLEAIRMPTLVIRGQHDNVCRASSKLLAAAIPAARSVVIPQAGHMAPLEAPAAFNDALVSFLSEHGA